MNSTEACIALNMLPTMGPVRLRRLLEVFRQPERVLAAKRDELRRIEGIGNEVAEQISNWESIVDLTAELKRISDFGASVITLASNSEIRFNSAVRSTIDSQFEICSATSLPIPSILRSSSRLATRTRSG